MLLLVLGRAFGWDADVKCIVKICEHHDGGGKCCTITKWEGDESVERANWVDVWDGVDCPGNDETSYIEFLETDQIDPFMSGQPDPEQYTKPWYRCRFRLWKHG